MAAEERWIWSSDHVIPSRTGAGRRVLEELLEQLNSHHWLQHDIFSIQLAMEEALVNAIKHGNHQDHAKHVRVACRMTPNLLRIEITDEGDGFDPSAIPNPTDPEQIESPRGRGIMLMRSFMSRVQFNEVGNHVVLEKDRALKAQNQNARL
jgi:serine/threonine-protein kinase RsbW